MAEKVRYPQIPSTVWWGVRAILTKTPNTTLDERALAIELHVQESAAKQYVAELLSVGIINDDKKATPLALKWRLNEHYSSAAEELAASIYPQSLRDIAPPSEGNRQKAVSWFMQEGLGQGAATNKAATYFLIGSPLPNESPVRSVEKSKAPTKNASKREQVKVPLARAHMENPRARQGSEIPLNVNVQIHISADATSDQIESIFSAMKRYLYDTPTN
jgi:hypothetical protein